MNKNKFVKELRVYLKHMQEEELNEIIADYEEHIDIGVSKGRDEMEVVRALGKPKTIAKHIFANQLIEKAKEERSAKNIFKAVLAVVGVGFFNLIFVLGPFIALLGILAAIWAVGFSFVVGGLAGIIAIGVGLGEVGIPVWAAVFFMISMSCAGGLVLIASFYLSKLFGILMLKYLKLNLKIIKKVEGKE